MYKILIGGLYMNAFIRKEIKTMLFTWNLKMKRQVKESKNMGTFDKKESK